ncbi:PAS domain S-box protein [Aerosakkonemataceae cyanobacterium BLCC-F154]|uniref:PAS domain S-box protein n=1 Tax=Floridaenema fluviatile BLCC-F154 TaxID=3153640 RepID=A0ABV4YFT5_9CYAN
MTFIDRITERSKAESLPKECKLLEESLINNIPGAIYRRRCDRDWTMEFISDAIADISGYSALDFIDNQIRSFASIIYSVDLEIIEQSIYESISYSKPYILEYRIIHADGTIKWVYEKGQAIVSHLGEIEFLDGVIFDITDRKIAELALRDSEYRYYTLTKSSPVGIFRIDAQGNCVYVNEKWCEIVGVSLEKALEKDWIEIIYPNDRERVCQRFKIAKRNNTAFKFKLEFRLQRSDNKIVWVLGQIVVEKDSDGKILGYVGTLTDISENKQIEEELRHREAKIRALLNAIPDLVVCMSKDGKILEYQTGKNSSMPLLSNMKVGTSIYEILPENLGQQFGINIEKTLVTNEMQTWEYQILINGDWRFRECRMVVSGRNEVIAIIRDITDKKKSEASLLQQAQIIDQIHDAVISMNLSGYINTWNKGAERLYGYSAAEIAGKHISILYPDPYCKLLQKDLFLLVLERGNYEIEQRLRKKDGEELDVHLSLSLLKDSQGLITGIISYGMDITQRRQAEIALRQRQQELKELIENAPDIITRFDRQLRHLYVNTAAEEVTGIAPKAFLGKTNRELGLPSELVTYWEQCMNDVFTTGKESQMEFEFNTPAGIRYYHARIVPEFSEIGEVETILAVTRDLTEQKQTERALKQSEKKLSLHVQNTPVAVIEFNLNFEIVEWNSAAEVIFGYSKNEIVGCFGWKIVPESASKLVREVWDNLLNEKEGNRTTNENLTKDGKIIICEWYNTPLIAEDGNCIGVSCLAQDISDRVQSELTLRQQVEREKLLVTITQRIHQSLNLEEILNTAVREVRGLLNSDRVLIYRIWSDGTGCVVTEAVVPDCQAILGRTFPVEVFPLEYQQLYSQGRILAMSDRNSATIAPCLVEFLRELAVKAKLVVPLMAGENLWGLLIAHHCREVRHWQPSEISLLQQLATQLGIAIQQALLVEQMEIANAELKRLACLDGLTHVANRRHFDEYLEREWRRMIREQNSIALILCDIDYFKLYNDTYGHLAGDSCLQQVADAIQRAVKRPADLVARYGGEEFAVILPNTKVGGALTVAKQIRAYVRELQIFHGESKTSKYVTLSVGVAVTVPSLHSSYNELIRTADSGLYEAKSQGRDRIVLKSFS